MRMFGMVKPARESPVTEFGVSRSSGQDQRILERRSNHLREGQFHDLRDFMAAFALNRRARKSCRSCFDQSISSA